MSDNTAGPSGSGESNPPQNPYGSPYVPPQDPFAAPAAPSAAGSTADAPAAGDEQAPGGNWPQPGSPDAPPANDPYTAAPTTPASAPYAPPASGPAQAPYGAPQYGAPQYGAPQYGAPQDAAPQYGAPQYGAPQYGAPQPPAGGYGVYAPPVKQSNVLAILALVFGIAAIVFSFMVVFAILLGIAAIVLGIIARAKRQSSGMSLAGIITGAVGIVLSVLLTIVLNVWLFSLGETVDRALDEAGSGVTSTDSPWTSDGQTHTIEVTATVDSGTATITYGKGDEQKSETFSGTFSDSFDIDGLTLVAVTVTPDAGLSADVEVGCKLTVDGKEVDDDDGSFMAICTTTAG